MKCPRVTDICAAPCTETPRPAELELCKVRENSPLSILLPLVCFSDYSSCEWLIIYWISSPCPQLGPFEEQGEVLTLISCWGQWERGAGCLCIPVWLPGADNNSFCLTFRQQICHAGKKCSSGWFLFDSFIAETIFPTYRSRRSLISWWLC